MQALETSRLLTEEYAVKVLVATMGPPKSATQLSEKLGIPIAACYRRIRALEQAGLLICVEKGLTQRGKREALYKAQIRTGQIMLEKNKVRVKLDMIDGRTENYNYDVDTSVFVDKPLRPGRYGDPSY
jgi:transcription initiation factor IIE alpha subunit